MAKEEKASEKVENAEKVEKIEKAEKSVEVPMPNVSKKSEIIIIFSALLTAAVIFISIMGVVFYIIIHNNVNGAADKYKNNIKNIPILRLALPKEKDPEEEKYLMEEEVRKKYEELRKANKDLKLELEELNKKILEKEKQIKELQEQKDAADKAKTEAQASLENQQETIAKEKTAIDQGKKKLEELIANADKEGIKEYFSQIAPEKAQEIYAEMIKDEQLGKKAKDFISLYEAVDPSTTAQILNELGEEKIDLIVEIIKNMKKDVSAEVLGAMDSTLAARVTEEMVKMIRSN